MLTDTLPHAVTLSAARLVIHAEAGRCSGGSHRASAMQWLRALCSRDHKAERSPLRLQITDLQGNVMLTSADAGALVDVSVPAGRLSELVAALTPTIAGVCPEARPIVFGHVNEGNLHVNVLDTGDLHDEVTDAVLRLVAWMDGSISSEHGVGRAKVAWLGLSRSPVEIAAMRAVKDALDPTGLFAPGVLFSA